ncbi:uncharacterized protein LOC114357366 [Ostrinia furnacalis]|uniref:uncharacterized protein LOC114357366 n=1 Tax=Ostrinia furnacalis TaxID=93504 RepID=UPI00103D7BC7|nr:uncharacterized protein LOC114357366 [Ostrinia furnacalis]
MDTFGLIINYTYSQRLSICYFITNVFYQKWPYLNELYLRRVQVSAQKGLLRNLVNGKFLGGVFPIEVDSDSPHNPGYISRGFPRTRQSRLDCGGERVSRRCELFTRIALWELSRTRHTMLQRRPRPLAR